eukprot:354028-Chlamydomonas_euryale.AAC.4
MAPLWRASSWCKPCQVLHVTACVAARVLPTAHVAAFRHGQLRTTSLSTSMLKPPQGRRHGRVGRLSVKRATSDRLGLPWRLEFGSHFSPRGEPTQHVSPT